MGTAPGSGDRGGRTAGWAALAVGMLYAAVSAYWGFGGSWLLSTVGAPFDQGGRDGEAAVMLLVWCAVVLKVIGAVLPVLVLRRLPGPVLDRAGWILAWIEAVVLTVYGLVWTVGGLLAVADIAGSPSRAQSWHAFLWDPWFLVWGILVTVALVRGRAGHVGNRPAG